MRRRRGEAGERTRPGGTRAKRTLPLVLGGVGVAVAVLGLLFLRLQAGPPSPLQEAGGVFSLPSTGAPPSFPEARDAPLISVEGVQPPPASPPVPSSPPSAPSRGQTSFPSNAPKPFPAVEVSPPFPVPTPKAPDPFLYPSAEASRPPLPQPPPGLPPLPAPPPLPPLGAPLPEVRYLGFSKGVRMAGAFAVAGEVMVLALMEGTTVNGVSFKVLSLSPQSATVLLADKKVVLKAEDR